MGTFEALAEALAARRDLGDWAVHGRKVTWATAGAGMTRRGRRDEVAARVHVDVPEGRGSADLLLDSPEPLDTQVDEARARAAASIGPGWQSSPPAAPARSAIADTRLGDPGDVAAKVLAALTAAVGAEAGASLVDVTITVERAERAVSTSRGLAARWSETRFAIDALVAVDAATARISAQGRRRADVVPEALAADAVQRARDRAIAVATPTGPRAVLLPASLFAGDAIAILDAIGAIADAALHRQGLARAHLGAPIVEGAEAAPEPLTVTSDGTLRWGLRSAPLGRFGEPVRRFPILEGGRLVGLGLDEREGALRGTPPNGGVANLVVSEGATDLAVLRGDGVLELRELRHIDLEPLTGRASLGVGLASLHGAAPQIVTGGEIQGDLIAALARSRRSSTHVAHAAYAGPDLILLPDLTIV